MRALRIGLLAISTLLSANAHAQMHVDRQFSLQNAPQIKQLPNKEPLQAPVPVLPAKKAVPATASAPTKHTFSYVSDIMGPHIFTKNVDYAVTFTPPTPVPQESSVTNVSWQYSLPDAPPELEAMLCWQEECLNISKRHKGRTGFFNGKNAAVPFSLYYQVKGTGFLRAPLLGSMNQLIVTYSTP